MAYLFDPIIITINGNFVAFDRDSENKWFLCLKDIDNKEFTINNDDEVQQLLPELSTNYPSIDSDVFYEFVDKYFDIGSFKKIYNLPGIAVMQYIFKGIVPEFKTLGKKWSKKFIGDLIIIIESLDIDYKTLSPDDLILNPKNMNRYNYEEYKFYFQSIASQIFEKEQYLQFIFGGFCKVLDKDIFIFDWPETAPIIDSVTPRVTFNEYEGEERFDAYDRHYGRHYIVDDDIDDLFKN